MNKELATLREGVERAIVDAKYKGEQSACYTHNLNDGYIDIWVDDRGNAEVVICQDDDKGREHPNIENAIFEAIPEWDDVEVEEWEEPIRFPNYGRL